MPSMTFLSQSHPRILGEQIHISRSAAQRQHGCLAPLCSSAISLIHFWLLGRVFMSFVAATRGTHFRSLNLHAYQRGFRIHFGRLSSSFPNKVPSCLKIMGLRMISEMLKRDRSDGDKLHPTVALHRNRELPAELGSHLCTDLGSITH